MMILRARRLLVGYPILVALLLWGAEQPKLSAGSLDSVGRVLEDETRASAIRNYLQAWDTLGQASAQNRADLLDAYFVGIAKTKLEDTLRDQGRLGIQVTYRDQTHAPEIVFYSPDGLSIQVLDNVTYRLEVRDQGRIVGGQEVHSRYVAVLTPTETKWKVRILQAEP